MHIFVTSESIYIKQKPKLSCPQHMFCSNCYPLQKFWYVRIRNTYPRHHTKQFTSGNAQFLRYLYVCPSITCLSCAQNRKVIAIAYSGEIFSNINNWWSNFEVNNIEGPSIVNGNENSISLSDYTSGSCTDNMPA